MDAVTSQQFTCSSIQENCDPQQVAAELYQPQPVLVVEGTLENLQSCYIMAEQTSILHGQVKKAVALLLASFLYLTYITHLVLVTSTPF